MLGGFEILTLTNKQIKNMLTLIVTAATTYVVGSVASFVGNGVYEIGRTYLDYYVLDRENGVDKDHQKGEEV